jgi:hypothetical protein
MKIEDWLWEQVVKLEAQRSDMVCRGCPVSEIDPITDIVVYLRERIECKDWEE